LLPGVGAVLEPVREQMTRDMAQKLTATDALLKDNIAKMVRSRVCAGLEIYGPRLVSPKVLSLLYNNVTAPISIPIV